MLRPKCAGVRDTRVLRLCGMKIRPIGSPKYVHCRYLGLFREEGEGEFRVEGRRLGLQPQTLIPRQPKP